jgi:hypothetical protein
MQLHTCVGCADHHHARLCVSNSFLQDDVERQELRVEMALAELSSHRQQDQRRAAAVDAAAGIDAFEMTLKRLGASAGSNTAGVSWQKARTEQVSQMVVLSAEACKSQLNVLYCLCAAACAEAPGPAVGESPMATLGRIRSFAPTAAKLADSKEEYLSVIKARRQEEAAARKEREVRQQGRTGGCSLSGLHLCSLVVSAVCAGSQLWISCRNKAC